ncbi:MAG: carbohydrate ABC transporter permease [Defluviitaleaceae bacterium]|nr:carbohydrate ABC transporter permease [Defluviitaleaceae bacterium]
MKVRRSNRIKQTRFDTVFGIVNMVFVCALLIVFLYPLLNVVAVSFSSSDAFASGKVWLLPVKPTLEFYDMLLRIQQIWVGYGNSIFYTAAGTTLGLVLTVMAAYPLSRKFMMGRRFLMTVFLITMFFSGGLIPTFVLVKNLGMFNTRAALIIPGAVSIWHIILARTYFMNSIPQELYDAAEIDGANDLRLLFTLLLPLSKPILAVLSLYSAVGIWNSYFSALVYLTDASKYPLQLVLRDYLTDPKNMDAMMRRFGLIGSRDSALVYSKRDVLRYAIIVVSSLPMVMLYPFIQRHFVKGVMLGSLKG